MGACVSISFFVSDLNPLFLNLIIKSALAILFFISNCLCISLSIFINYSIGKINKGKNMKAIMYVSLLWVVLGILISFVAV